MYGQASYTKEIRVVRLPRYSHQQTRWHFDEVAINGLSIGVGFVLTNKSFGFVSEQLHDENGEDIVLFQLEEFDLICISRDIVAVENFGNILGFGLSDHSAVPIIELA